MIRIWHIQKSIYDRLPHLLCLTALLAFAPASQAIGWRDIPIEDPAQESFPYYVFDATGDFYLSQFTASNNRVRKISGTTGVMLWERLNVGGPIIVVGERGDVACMRTQVQADSSRKLFVTMLSGQTGSTVWDAPVTNLSGAGNKWLAFDPQNNVLVCGFTGTQTNFIVTVSKLDGQDGNLRWQISRDLGLRSVAWIAADPRGDVILIMAASSPDFSQRRYRAQKFDGNNGTLRWNWEDLSAESLFLRYALDENGNLIINGQCKPAAMYTAKVANADGRLMWRNVFTNQESVGLYSLAITNQDVVSVGYKLSNGIYSTYAARYAAEDGSLVWDRLLESPRLSVVPFCFYREQDGHVLVGTFDHNPSIHTYKWKLRKLNIETGGTISEISRDYDYYPVEVVPGPFGRFAYFSDSYDENNVYKVTKGLFHIGPEVITRSFPDHLEISWEPQNLGWTLQRSSSGPEPLIWYSLETSTTTNLLRLPKTESASVFRLVRQ